MKYRKKPVEVEAIQLTKENIASVYKFVYGIDAIKLFNTMAEDRWEVYEQDVKEKGFKLMTLESDGQTQTASIGDYIIKGIAGEFYPCKPEIFEKTYENV